MTSCGCKTITEVFPSLSFFKLTIHFSDPGLSLACLAALIGITFRDGLSLDKSCRIHLLHLDCISSRLLYLRLLLYCRERVFFYLYARMPLATPYPARLEWLDRNDSQGFSLQIRCPVETSVPWVVPRIILHITWATVITWRLVPDLWSP